MGTALVIRSEFGIFVCVTHFENFGKNSFFLVCRIKSNHICLLCIQMSCVIATEKKLRGCNMKKKICIRKRDQGVWSYACESSQPLDSLNFGIWLVHSKQMWKITLSLWITQTLHTHSQNLIKSLDNFLFVNFSTKFIRSANRTLLPLLKCAKTMKYILFILLLSETYN